MGDSSEDYGERILKKMWTDNDNFKIYDNDRRVYHDHNYYNYKNYNYNEDKRRAVLRAPTLPASSSSAMLILIPVLLLILLMVLCYIVLKKSRERAEASSVQRHQPNVDTTAQQATVTRQTQSRPTRFHCCRPPIRNRQELQLPDNNEEYLDAIIRYLEDNSDLVPLSSATLSQHSNMPPPYSECVRPSHAGATRNKVVSEEPPPPYSTCYVAYTRRENAEPQVHIHRETVRDERAQSSTDIDNAQNNLISISFKTDSETRPLP